MSSGMILYPTDDEITEFLYASYVLTCKKQIRNKPPIYTETIDRMISNIDKRRSKAETILG